MAFAPSPKDKIVIAIRQLKARMSQLSRLQPSSCDRGGGRLATAGAAAARSKPVMGKDPGNLVSAVVLSLGPFDPLPLKL